MSLGFVMLVEDSAKSGSWCFGSLSSFEKFLLFPTRQVWLGEASCAA